MKYNEFYKNQKIVKLESALVDWNIDNHYTSSDIDTIDVCNPDDIDWTDGVYIVHISQFDHMFLVFADNESDAIDSVIDTCRDLEYTGLISTYSQLIDDGYTDDEINDHVCGGNECLYLNTHYIRIEKVM